MKKILCQNNLMQKSRKNGNTIKRCIHTSSVLYNEGFNPSMASYLESAYRLWKNDRNTLDKSWDQYFTNICNGMPNQGLLDETSRIIYQNSDREYGERHNNLRITYVNEEMIEKGKTGNIYDIARVAQLIRWYQKNGHLYAQTNPLPLPNIVPYTSIHNGNNNEKKMTYKNFGFTEEDLKKEFSFDLPSITGFSSYGNKTCTLECLINKLEETYCQTIGFEYMHISDENIVNYIRKRIENDRTYHFSNNEKKEILEFTARAFIFENYMAAKFATTKRFGVDGCETLITGMKKLVKRACKLNIDSVLMGMSHRGRLNVLFNVLHKPLEQMMSEFRGKTGFSDNIWGNTGDVKYHLGVEIDHYDEESNRYIHLGIVENSSHLESVNPILMGQTRAQQYYCNDKEKKKVLPIIIHGDASIAGQGIAYETFQMSKLPSYSVGGTIHIVVNNQIGFTTYPVDARSGKYCTDIGKCIDIPIIHVNADDPEAVTYVFDLALDIRNKFNIDTIIDLVGYRKYGHNELDMPKFTNPLLYDVIARHKSVLDIYSKKLIDENVITLKEFEENKKKIYDYYEQVYEQSKNFEPKPMSKKYLPQWEHMVNPQNFSPSRKTGVEKDILINLGKQIFTIKKNFNPHPIIAKLFKSRITSLETGDNIDFGTAELLAYATLLSDGFHARISGQDSQRGTFSHRHAILHDQTTYEEYNIFDSLKTPHTIEVNNSLLSEYACLGYEIGYSYEHPDALVVWEAQFGDFANGAQVMIDNYIASGETKWNKQSGIVMLLPHGYDGQGPEHSSARIERFLQLCDDREDIANYSVDKDKKIIQQHNMQVINCTKPSNLFHALRRQMHRAFRKPLVVITPKKMLKMRMAFDNINNFLTSTEFLPYLAEEFEHKLKPKEEIKRIILCSGQVYYDLLNYRDTNNIQNIAIARIEQLSPFPFKSFMNDLKNYPNLRDVIWVQEEHMNMGPWFYVSRRIEAAIKQLKNDIPSWNIEIPEVNYSGRDVYAAQSAGDLNLHLYQLDEFLVDAFDLNKKYHMHAQKYINSP
ncbi:2-oxoglutarate dehydrogenase E1 component, putative [Plasmodium vinckei vinckei]|uniref:2-oxoglutarate dehydrogenase E1 component, putative n=1 Tax=Plasmodium vinckei vinckei TaxID=54757 RepID=A0A081IB04_PLAVN|nr:2-oxoglutarate dehydrogenase E1 component, putative [Plasmodium vinckei vinckei]KEG00862.1 oxoglutarate dehydrogenase (succinyl-transferring), E1 component [Plasmodium vinckei vinckei]VEV55723.1 2-oxoglutarate dehydrogenase E1 component, putative [Plasmodium vinckei vinckei]